MKARSGVGEFLRLIVLAVAGLAAGSSAQTTTNAPPHVWVVAPADGMLFPPGASILLKAEAADRDGSVVSVEFFAGNRSLGFGDRTASSPNLFVREWREVPAGTYLITARATDNFGASRFAVPVQIVVGGPPPPPHPIVVTVRAADAYAVEPCDPANVRDPGRFVITRDRGTNIDLTVSYRVGGTAVNGKDYEPLTGLAVIPKGAWSAEVWVKALVDDLEEGPESVVMRLEPLACIAIFPPPPECYLVGQPSEAAVYIKDCAFPENRAPMVRIVKPVTGQTFLAPAEIPILTDTWDVDGYVWKVEFFEGTNKIGEDHKLFLVPPTNGTHIPYEMTWKDVRPGRYTLKARAQDAMGKHGWSAPVEIAVVTNKPPPPPTNAVPVISIVASDPLAIEGTNCWGWPSLTNRWPDGTTNVCSTDPTTDCRFWWYTNCGPKNAAFTVRRVGNTNDDLIVKYAVHGTATNAVDYEELSGFVKIPAGERRAAILIVPKEDAQIEPPETVILRLLPSPEDTNTAEPACRIGYPYKAGAVIVDSARPRLRTSALGDRSFYLAADAVDGTWYRIEYSTDLTQWTPVCTSPVVQGAVHFVDPDAQEATRRFYRAVPDIEPAE